VFFSLRDSSAPRPPKGRGKGRDGEGKGGGTGGGNGEWGRGLSVYFDDCMYVTRSEQINCLLTAYLLWFRPSLQCDCGSIYCTLPYPVTALSAVTAVTAVNSRTHE
jgi:hypothetical protein